MFIKELMKIKRCQLLIEEANSLVLVGILESLGKKEIIERTKLNILSFWDKETFK